MSKAQYRMLSFVVRHSGRVELGEVVMECAGDYDGGLAWRIADRTAGALIRRALIALDGDIVSITDAGYYALSSSEASHD